MFPSSEGDGGNTLIKTIENYWMAHINWNWSISLSMRFSLAPWDSVYKINKTHQIRSQIQQYKTKNLCIQKEQELEMREKVIELLEKLKEQNEKALDIATERFVFSESLYTAGRISQIDFRLQKVVVKESECNLLQTRIDYLLTLLGFY